LSFVNKIWIETFKNRPFLTGWAFCFFGFAAYLIGVFSNGSTRVYYYNYTNGLIFVVGSIVGAILIDYMNEYAKTKQGG